MNRLFILLLIVPSVGFAQPGTEIYVGDLSITNDKIAITNATNITNRVGYDNQPFFHPDSPLIYFVSADSASRTDIFSYHLIDGTTKRVTKTHDKEYSPTVTPDKKFISCILQNDSGAQHLVKYPIGGGSAQSLIRDKIVGYHAWATGDQVVVFTLPAPFKLELVNVKSKQSITIDKEIGRSLHKIPGKEAISYLKKISDTEWRIDMYDVNSHQSTSIAQALPGPEHFMTWTSDLKILMSDNNAVYFIAPAQSTTWKKVEVDQSFPSKTITRMAVSPDLKKIALVVSE